MEAPIYWSTNKIGFWQKSAQSNVQVMCKLFAGFRVKSEFLA